MEVKEAQVEDAEGMAEIYNDEVLHGCNNYAVEQELVTDRRQWMETLIRNGFPVLVAKENHKVIAFGALTPFHPIEGYKTTVSGVMYVHKDHRRKQVASLIGNELIKSAKAMGVRCILAGINSENFASIAYHKSFGFEQVGFFKDIAFKHGRFHSDVCMQLIISSKE